MGSHHAETDRAGRHGARSRHVVVGSCLRAGQCSSDRRSLWVRRAVRRQRAANVPPRHVKDRLWTIQTSDGSIAIRCGNGSTWGAVHVELKHEVPNWPDALTCIKKTINRGTELDGGNGKTKYVHRIRGATVVVIVGDNGLVTAYPKGTGVVRKWRLCSAS